MLELYDDLKIYSKYGEDWDHQVDNLCDHVSFDTCLALPLDWNITEAQKEAIRNCM